MSEGGGGYCGTYGTQGHHEVIVHESVSYRDQLLHFRICDDALSPVEGGGGGCVEGGGKCVEGRGDGGVEGEIACWRGGKCVEGEGR